MKQVCVKEKRKPLGGTELKPIDDGLLYKNLNAITGEETCMEEKETVEKLEKEIERKRDNRPGAILA